MHEPAIKPVLPLVPHATYLAMICGSVGSNLFRHLYVREGAEAKDLLRDGQLSCAFFVSSLLWHFSLLVEGPHAGVGGLIRDLEKSSWRKVSDPVPGAVLIWEKAAQAGGEMHLHCGFYIGNDRAISNSDKERAPTEHDWQFGSFNNVPARKVVAIYAHDFLAQ